MQAQERAHRVVGQYLAAVVVVSIGGQAVAGFIDQRAGRSVEHGNRGCMHESTHARGVRAAISAAVPSIDAPQFVPVAAALVAVTEMGGGMKHHIAAGQRGGEGADLAHVALHHLHLRQIRELLARLVHGSGQRPHRNAARASSRTRLLPSRPVAPVTKACRMGRAGAPVPGHPGSARRQPVTAPDGLGGACSDLSGVIGRAPRSRMRPFQISNDI